MIDASTRKTLGVWSQFGLAAAWPELPVLLNRLYTDRVAKLPWVPKDWFVQVMAAQAEEPGNLIVIGPALNALGGRNSDAPDFADSEDKLHAWQEIYKMTEAAVGLYADGKAIEGRSAMTAAYMNSAFWNQAYAIAVAIRDLPANAVDEVLGGTESVLGGVLKNMFSHGITYAVLIVVSVGALWYFGAFRRKSE